MDEIPQIDINKEAVESAEQDQAASMYRLILLYNFRKIDQWSRTAR